LTGLTALEVVLALGLLALLVGQLLGYPATDDPDPDGFVTYARHILGTGTLLPESRRLPGYAAFSALAWAALDRPPQQSVYWAQLALTTAFLGGLWLWLRPRIGRLPALLFLGIVAAPSYFARLAVVMLPDAVFSMLWLPVTLASCWWALADRPRGGWLWLLPIAAGQLFLQALRPNAAPMAVLLAGSLVVVYVAERLARRRVSDRFNGSVGRKPSVPPLRPFVARAGALVGVAVLAFVAADRLLDTGARAYNLGVVGYRVVVYLPPASDSPAERRLEEAKARFREIEGGEIEDARFLSYRRFQFSSEMDRADVEQVWLPRLLARPDLYVASVGRDLLLNHYLLARRVLPFFVDLPRIPLFVQQYPPNDSSPQSRLFRATGLLVLDAPPLPEHYPFAVEAGRAVGTLVAVWGLLLLGAWRLAQRHRPLVVTFGVLLALSVLMSAATNTADPRYLLPFALPVYAAQAVGLAELLRLLGRRSVDKE